MSETSVISLEGLPEPGKLGGRFASVPKTLIVLIDPEHPEVINAPIALKDFENQTE